MQSLPHRSSHCVLEGEHFDPGMEYVSLLSSEGHRKDYCLRCWHSVGSTTDGSFWHGKIPDKKDKTPLPDEKALELFRQMNDPKQRFVLALYLQRKQQLVRRTQTLYEIPKTGEIFDIEKVSLTSEEGEALAREIDRFIG